MIPFKDFYIVQESNVLILENIISNIVTGIIQRRQRKERDPALRKKAVESIARIKRMLKDYNVEVGRAYPTPIEDEPSQNKRRGPNYIPRFKDPEEMTPKERERYESDYQTRPEAEGSYHAYSHRKEKSPDSIGISKQDVRTLGKKKIKTPYLRALFILAHEAGHAMQYGPPDKNFTNEVNQDVEDITNQIFKEIPQRGMNMADYSRFVETFIQVYTELMAWDRGRNFIPQELWPEFNDFAKTAYSSYMKARPEREYYAVPMIRELMDKLDYHGYEEEETQKPAGSLMSVPIKAMGMSRSSEALPNEKPYGFWMDRSGNFIKVRPEEHIQVAWDILTLANQWFEKHGQGPIDMRDLYEALQGRGWARIVFEPNSRGGQTMWVDYSDINRKPTPRQESMFKEMMQKYGISELKRGDEHA